MRTNAPPAIVSVVEIERKFLVEQPPAELERAPRTEIAQGYLVLGADGSEARVRRRDRDRTLTVKRGRGRVRDEGEIRLGDEQFERLWPLTEDRRLEKTRYELDLGGGLTGEVDVYAGALDGLVVVEVEFPDADAAERFVAPPWFGREVTDDDAYKNRRLATDGRPA